jgi:AAA ATPase-like protein
MKFNPFVPNGIAYPGMFIGRIAEIEKIEHAYFQTKNGNPQHLLFSGERGIGKSSLVSYADLIARSELESTSMQFDFLTISTDLAGVSTQGGIIKQIGRELRSKLKSHKKLQEKTKHVWEFISSWEILGVKYNGKEENIDPDAALDDLISLFLNILKTKKFDGIAILLDEADNPPTSANLGEFVKIITERLAKRNCYNVMLFLAGQPLLLGKLRDSHESSLRVFQILDMKPLEEYERIQVVERGIEIANERNEEKTSITDKAKELIASLSEGYPHFIQQFSYSAFEYDSDDEISDTDVLTGTFSENGAIHQLGTKYFSELYYSKISSEDYRKVLNFMATHGDDWVSRKEIVHGCTSVAEHNVTNALSALKKRDIILTDDARTGYYRLPTKSFATWIIAIKSSKIR